MASIQGNITISDDYIISVNSPVPEITESIGETFFKHMKIHQDKIAQIDAKTGEKNTYAALLQRCVRTALHMKDRNITNGDKVTVCMKYTLDSVIPYIATQFLGAVIAPTEPAFSEREMIHFFNLVRPKILFAPPEIAPKIEKVLKEIHLDSEIVVFGKSLKYTEFSEFLKPHKDEKGFQPYKLKSLRDTAVIHFSSGTTGLPKGVCLSHYAFSGQTENFAHADYPDYAYMKKQTERISFPLIFLGYSPLYGISAGTTLLACINGGYCRLLCEKFDSKEAWNYIEKYKPFAIVCNSFEAKEMVDNKRDDVDVRSIVSIVLTGSSTSKEYTLKIHEAFPEADFSRPYGQTELCGIVLTFRGNDLFHRPIMYRDDKLTSVGLPIRGNSYKVVDPITNKNLGPNQKGELRIKSEFVMNGYLNTDPSESFDDEGWLKTEDLVYYDEDFCFYMVDRMRETFKNGGWYISPLMLENVLLNHPAVKYGVIICVPRGDVYHPMALVVLKEGHQATEEEIRKFVDEKLEDREKLRAGVKIVKNLPFTPTGKVKRKEVRDKVLEGSFDF